jgi:hypothetical protein
MEVIYKSRESRVCALDELVLLLATAAVMRNTKGEYCPLCFVAIANPF